MSAELLRVEGLRYLENGPYSFVLHANEVLGLTGPSGVGKTQLLRALVQCLAGEGAIFYKGRPIDSFAAPEWRKMVPITMTGQILGGSPPLEAVKYQILILFLIAAGTGFGVISAIWLTNRKLFDKRHRLCLEQLKR